MSPQNTTAEQPDHPLAGIDDRWQRTAVAAFFLAEARGFAPGHELDDWLAAEREIAATGAVRVAGSGVAEVASPSSSDRSETSAAPPAKRARRPARKGAAAAPDSNKAVASTKAASTKRRNVRTRKTKPGVDSELGGAA